MNNKNVYKNIYTETYHNYDNYLKLKNDFYEKSLKLFGNEKSLILSNCYFNNLYYRCSYPSKIHDEIEIVKNTTNNITKCIKCAKCKKEKDEEQFKKYVKVLKCDKILKTCNECRLK